MKPHSEKFLNFFKSSLAFARGLYKRSLVNFLCLNENLGTKKFNKLKLLEFVGFLSRRLNYASLQFEKSNYLTFKAYLKLFLVASVPLKLYVSTFFPQTDTIQLAIGSLYNAFPETARLVNWHLRKKHLD